MHKRLAKGFTVVELLTVIVIIALLAAVTVVGYNAVTDNAVKASMKSDLKNAVTSIAMYRADNKKIPDTVVDLSIETTDDNVIVYTRQADGYCASVSSSRLHGVVYRITRDTNTPEEGDCYTPEECYYATTNLNEVTITGKVYGCGDYHVIPRTIGSNPVTTISYFGSAKSVIIPDTVKSIGVTAFVSPLEYVSIPSSVVSIGQRAFFGVGLESVIIPKSITKIENGVFRANKLRSVNIPDSVTEIGQQAFSVNEIENVTIPGSVTSIGSEAFWQNNMTSVTIPGSVTTIGNDAFGYNPGIVCRIPTGKSFPNAGCASIVHY